MQRIHPDTDARARASRTAAPWYARVSTAVLIFIATLAAELNRSDALRAQRAAVADLFKALGGGWQSGS